MSEPEIEEIFKRLGNSIAIKLLQFEHVIEGENIALMEPSFGNEKIETNELQLVHLLSRPKEPIWMSVKLSKEIIFFKEPQLTHSHLIERYFATDSWGKEAIATNEGQLVQ